MSKTVRVAVTGAAGQIGYQLLFRIASGEIFGRNTPVALNLVEVEGALKSLQGVVMELDDCAFPLLQDVVVTADPKVGFQDVNWALLVGAAPRKQGMERKDLIRINGPIFVGQGRALAEKAASDVRVLVVGNPCNTNCLIARNAGSSIPADRWFAMTRLDENRARSQLAKKAGVPVYAVSNMAIWGNHSTTQYPDFFHARIHGQPVPEVIQDHDWLRTTFVSTVQKRGAAVIEARGASSAASAANAALDTVKSLESPTRSGEWHSVAVVSDGSYDVEEGLVCGFPVRTTSGGWEIVQGLALGEFGRQKLDASLAELREERTAVADLLQG